MDKPKSVDMELDWHTIKIESERLDDGDHSPICLRAKMLSVAFEEGYHSAMMDQVNAANALNLLFIQPEGTA